MSQCEQEINMNKTLATILIVLAVVLLAAGIFFAGRVYGRSYAYGPGWMMGAYRWNNNTASNPGGMMNMMGRSGNGAGPGGMMSGYGGMMNGYGSSNDTPLTVDQAKAAAEAYLANLRNDDLKIAEIMIFDNNAYVVAKENNTGIGAFELLVDPSSQSAYPEHGPNMMWNLKYGGLNHENMMGNNSGMMGMMGGSNGMMNMMGGNGWDPITPAEVPSDMTVTPEQAVELAQKYLDANITGATAATDPIQFYGYYTLDFEKDGKVAGMLSVNGYSGQVFLHTWHGSFIEETELN
jgi:hypothetical protein